MEKIIWKDYKKEIIIPTIVNNTKKILKINNKVVGKFNNENLKSFNGEDIMSGITWLNPIELNN